MDPNEAYPRDKDFCSMLSKYNDYWISKDKYPTNGSPPYLTFQ